MIVYLIQMTSCALLLYVIYALALERENRHRFKRIYLLAALVFSMLAPFIVLEVEASKMPVSLERFYNGQTGRPSGEKTLNEEKRQYATGIIEQNFVKTSENPEKGSSTPLVNYSRLLLWIYLTFTSLILFRLIRNFRRMVMQARTNEKLDYQGAKLILVKEKVMPHSFGRFIFMNREDYYSGLIPDEIIVHELAHVKQRHSYDMLFIELLIAFGWFNPVFYLYRSKIRQNHEFLADDAVVGRNKAIIPNYLTLLINQVSQNKKISFTSYFNYLITKKRLIMITKTTSKKRVWCSSLALIPVFIAAIFIFSTKTIAQHDMHVPLEQTGINIEMPVQDNPPKVTPDLPQDSKLAELLKDSIFAARYEEYNQIIEKNTKRKEQTILIDMGSISQNDLRRMQTLYQSMSPEQQSVLTFVANRMPAPKEKIPTQEEFESWKDSTQYGVWLDGKRVDNAILNQYQHSDFSNYFVSRLAKNAKNYGKHVYQLDLHTTADFKRWKEASDADERLYLLPNRQIPKTQ